MKQNTMIRAVDFKKIRPSVICLSLSCAILTNCASTGTQQQDASSQDIGAQQGQDDDTQTAQQGNQSADESNENAESSQNSANITGGSNGNFATNFNSNNSSSSEFINNVATEDGDEATEEDLGLANTPGNIALPEDLPPTESAAPSNLALNTPVQEPESQALLGQTNPAIAPSNSTGTSGSALAAPTASVPSAVNQNQNGPEQVASPQGTVNWVGYNYDKSGRKIEVQIVTAGSPNYRMFQEVNRGGQSELVVRFLNSKLRKKIRRDIDATEFRSPVAYVRMRHDASFGHTDVVMTMREESHPRITTKGSNLMFTFDIPEHWYAPKGAENPVAAAEIISDDKPGMSAMSADEKLPGEAPKTSAAYIADPGKDVFSNDKEIKSAPLVPKSESDKELIPANDGVVPPEGQQLLDNRRSPFREVSYVVHGVAQADFSSDIPSAGEFSVNQLLEDVPLNQASSPVSAEPAVSNAATPQADIVGVSTDGLPTPVTSKKKALRLDFRDAPISQIIRMIANESSINFIIAPEAGTKKTSISLKNVPWDVALKAVLESNRLGMQEIAPGLVRIDFLKTFSDDREAEEKARQATEALVPTKVLVMPLNYAKADDAVKLAQAMLPKPTDPTNMAQKRNYERFKAQSDPRSNAVIVEATPNVLSTIKTLLERLDAQTPQVRIASRLVEVNSDISDGLGVTWGAPLSYDPGRGLGFGSLPFPNFFTSQFAVDPGGAAVPGGSAAFKFGSLNNAMALELRLRMYETNRKAETLQTQDVVVQDNEKATVTAGTTDYFVTSGGVGTAGGLAEVNYNLSLNVTPHITADGAVQMKLDIKGDSPSPSAGSAAAAASKATRQLTTTLLKRSGETAVIGGLYSSEVSKVQRGVPFLSRLPLLGALFRSTENKDVKKDLLIMVTPTIVGLNSATNGSATGAEIPVPMNAAPMNTAINNSSNYAPINQADNAQSANAQSTQQEYQQQTGQSQNTATQNGNLSNGQSSNASLESNGLD